MIKLFCLALLITTISSAQIQNDHLIHIGGSYVMSSMTTAIVYNKTKNKKKAIVCGAVVSLVLGVGKEVVDNRLGSKDTRTDLLSNVVGTTLGIITIKIAI
jgi:VanZ family protein